MLNVATLRARVSAIFGWSLHTPSGETQGGTALSGYIPSGGYIDFTAANKKLGNRNGTGFWVNR